MVHLPAEQRSPSRAATEGEVFVPFSVLPAAQTNPQGGTIGPITGAALAVRLRSVEGLNSTAGRLHLAFRFGPPGAAGLPMDKSKEVSVKYQMELVKEGATWLPEGIGRGGAVRVLLPATLLAQAARGIVCQIKISTPGYVTANVLAVSGALSVPLESGPVPLAAAKSGRGSSTPGGTATLSVSRLFTAEAQAVMVRGLVQTLLAHLRQPAGAGGAAGGRPSQQGGIPAALDALRPSRGWLPAANLAEALAHKDGQGRGALRLAVDGRHWDCVQPLVEAACDLRALSEDFRSPLTAALEQGERSEAVLGQDLTLGPEARRVGMQLSVLLRESRAAAGQGHSGGSAAARRWEELAEEVSLQFCPPVSVASGAAANSAWSGDVFVVALEHCPTGRARRKLLCIEGTCAALWRVSLCSNLPGLARKLAVWIGLSVSASGCAAGSPTEHSRRHLLDVQLDAGVEDAMLSRALERGMEDERWVKVAKVMVHLGAAVTAGNSSGRSLLLLTLEQADQGRGGFRELLASLLLKLGSDVDHWEHPTVLVEENTAECPICMEVLWTSTPTAFVSFAVAGQSGEGNPHLICAHYFCFDCASQQYMKQLQRQSAGQNAEEFQCPICRAPAREVMPLPDIQVNPRLWFQFLDTNSSGGIDQNTVVQTLEAMLPIDTENLRDALDDGVWAEWDKAGDNRITEREFFRPGGLLEWVRRHQCELQAAQQRGQAPPLGEAEVWFRHWDSQKRGRLNRGELLRALCEEARISSLQPRRIEQLKVGIEGVIARHGVEEASGCGSQLQQERTDSTHIQQIKALPRERLLREEVLADLAAAAREAGQVKSGPPLDAGLAGFVAMPSIATTCAATAGGRSETLSDCRFLPSA